MESVVERMSRPEAVERMMRIAGRECGLDDVRALQVGVRCVCKRWFDQARRLGKKRDAGTFRTDPPEAPFDAAARRLEELAEGKRGEFLTSAVVQPPWEERTTETGGEA